jgi:hypothetical protein
MPPMSGRSTGPVVGIVAVLVVGAILALGVERLIGATLSPGASDTSAPSDALASDAVPTDTGPLPSDVPAQSPASPILEGLIPQSVDGTTLTTQSATDATSLTNTPNGRALDAAITKLGKQPADLEIAVGADDSGTIDLSITGFRVAGVDPAKLRTLVLDTWLSASTPGVATSTVNLAGVPTTEVSYGDSGPNEYVLVRGDAVFILETADAKLAADAAKAMSGPAPSGSTPSAPTPSGSPAG